MRLVVDTNILIASLLKDGLNRKLIMQRKYELLAPAYMLEEIARYEEYISKKSALTIEQIQFIIESLAQNIVFLQKEEYEEFLTPAASILEDKEDAPFLAVACKEQVDGIWSHDKGFTKQGLVRVVSTKELIEMDEEQ